MARVVNEVEFNARRNQILDVARKLIYSRGYEQMSIQDILGELKMSKGAFYHYFDSKPVLLEALIERMLDEGEILLASIWKDPELSAIEKLHIWFDTSTRWKTAQKTYLIAIARVWYSDDNAIIRQKMFFNNIKRFTPLFVDVIRQGIQQGDLKTPYPEQVPEMIFYLFQGLNDKFSELLISYEMEHDPSMRAAMLLTIKNAVAAYTDALERVLGIPTGCLKVMDKESIEAWFSD